MMGGWFLDLTPDLRVFAYTFGLSFVSGTMFGLIPALRASDVDLASALKEGGQQQGQRWIRSRLRSGLVVVQVALCLVLLINAGLLARSLANANSADPGFDADHIMIVQLDLAHQQPIEPARAWAFAQEIMQRIARLPSVESVAAAPVVPLLASSWKTVTIEGQEARSQGEVPVNLVTASYFDTFRIPILRGRAFTTQEVRDNVPVVIVSQGAAQRFWPGQSPIGKRLRIGVPADDKEFYTGSTTVVGVAKDTRSVRLAEIDPAYIYLPLAPASNSAQGVHLFVRTTGKPAALTGLVRREVRAVMHDLRFLTYAYEFALYFQRLPAKAGAILSLVLGLLALVLASVGLYGVMSYAVSQRTHEIGIRMALGARRADVVRMVIGQGMKLVAVGLALGVTGAIPLARVLAFLLYGISPLDPLTFAGVSALLTLVALAATWVPATRASRLDPLGALHHE
jgi:predicted permease